MKGQRLLVRPIVPTDLPALRTLDPGIENAMAPSASGYLGKLVGETVAYALTSQPVAEELEIRAIFVTERLRKKRVGTGMLQEIERLTNMTLTISPQCHAPEFFKAAGFVSRNGTLRRESRENP